jgi:hypothetical protein
MAGRSSGVSMVAAHRLFAPARPAHTVDQGVELDEADVIWGGGGTDSPYSSPTSSFLSSAGEQYGRSAPSKAANKPRRSAGQGPASLPVNIPDWSKILGAEYAGSAGAQGWAHDDGEDGAACGGRRWVPPHELLQCRERAAACFSVREGAGRTLKGRDLRRVRNAIWEKTGFQD